MPQPTRFIDPLNDVAFKKIFGSEPNKDLLINFLNEVFRGRKQIADLVYNKNEHHGNGKDDGSVSFDLLCTGIYGEQFIIEVQREKHRNFIQRSLVYTSRLISEQVPKGKVKQWNYDLKEVYLVAILEKFSIPGINDGFLHDICLCNRETGEIFYDQLGYTYIQLLNFVKQEDELENDLDKWLYVLKHISKMDRIPVYLRKPIFEKLFNIAEYSNLTKEEKMSYDLSLMRQWDQYSALETAREEGLEKGLQQGLDKGRERGIRETAANFKKLGVSAEDIAKATGLPIEEINKL